MLSKDVAPRAAKDSPFRTNNTLPSTAKSDCRYPRTAQLGGRNAILGVIRDGLRLSRGGIGLTYSTSDGTRFGIGVSKSYGNAVKRNRAKRVIREYLRQNKNAWPTNKAVFIRLRTQIQAESDIISELKSLIAKIK